MPKPLMTQNASLTPEVVSHRRRFEALVREEFDFVWRSLRRLGLSGSDAEDGAQRVFLNLSEKLASVESGRERAYLYATAVRIAASMRRRQYRQREEPTELVDAISRAPYRVDDLLEQRRARQLLDDLLAELPTEQRMVVILAEVEQMSKREIAHFLGLAEGTVASRLRLGRAQLERRIHALRTLQGGER